MPRGDIALPPPGPPVSAPTPAPWSALQKATGIEPNTWLEQRHDWQAAHPWLQALADFFTGGATNVDFEPGPADAVMAALPLLGPAERAALALTAPQHLAAAPTERAAGSLLVSGRVPTAVGAPPAPPGRALTVTIDD